MNGLPNAAGMLFGCFLVACLLTGLGSLSARASEPHDKYAYLEDLDSPETKTWITDQDKRARVVLSSLGKLEAARKLLAPYETASNMNLPQKRGNMLFYLDETLEVPQPSLYLQQAQEPAMLIVNPLEFGAGHVISRFDVTEDAAKIAVEISSPTSGQSSVHVFDVLKQRFYPQTILDAHMGVKSWFEDGRSLVFWRKDSDELSVYRRQYLSDDGSYRDHAVYRHMAGPVRFQVWASDNSVVVQQRYENGEYDAKRIWLKSSESTVLVARKAGPLYYLGDHGGTSYFYSTDHGSNGQVFTIRADGSGARAVVLTPDYPVNGLHLVGGNLLVEASVDGKPMLRLYSGQGNFRTDIAPPFGLVWNDFPQGSPAVWGSPDSDIAYYRSTALSGSGIYEIDVAAAQQRPLWQRYPVEADRLVSQYFFLSTDGVRVPVTIVSSDHGAGSQVTGPVLVWAYGAYGFTAWPFHNAFFAAFLDAGGKIAFPHVRGGGVYGAEWRKAGAGKNKINTVKDVIGVVNWLIEQGYSVAGKIALLGNSAGSVPVARAAFELSDKIGALLLEVPLSDMERYAEWAPFWTREFGDPERTDELAVLQEISPYRMARALSAFPPTMIVAGEKDRTAIPHHAYKLASVMQDRQKGPGDILLYSVKDAGHSIGHTREQRLESWAYELSFLFDALEMSDADQPLQRQVR